MIRSLSLVVLSFVLGQYSIINAYDPKDLEISALMFLNAAYYSGCIHGHQKDCEKASKDYVDSVKQIWADNAWKGIP